MIKAVELADGKRAAVDFALAVRKAFFVEARDISDLTFLHELVKKQSLDGNRIEQAISGGMAVASLLGDYQQANKQGIKGSPSYVVDNGRQTLYGNVGYRVLHANIEELLKSPADEANWC